MEQWLEKIAQDAFNDELEKVAIGQRKVMKAMGKRLINAASRTTHPRLAEDLAFAGRLTKKLPSEGKLRLGSAARKDTLKGIKELQKFTGIKKGNYLIYGGKG